MTEDELTRYASLLRRTAARLRGEVSGLRDEALQGPAAAAEGPSGVPPRQADPGSYEAAEGVAITLLGAEQRLLAEVEAALGRVARKAYGRCEGCRKAISRSRLNALPYARYCVACARRHEPLASA